MGLTINYSLRLKRPRTTARTRRLLKWLRAIAGDLPLQEIAPLTECRPKRCHLNRVALVGNLQGSRPSENRLSTAPAVGKT